jgi:hypothetical protein
VTNPKSGGIARSVAAIHRFVLAQARAVNVSVSTVRGSTAYQTNLKATRFIPTITGTMLETEKIATEHPEAVRSVAEKTDDPLKSKLVEIVEEATHE